MVLVYSATKGLAAMALALAHSRGWLDYDERVCAYWPEFAQAGKERITVRQLLAHQAGLFGFDEKVDRAVVADPDRLAGIMARQRPAWAPGERQAYHAISLGFYEGEIIRRVDPAAPHARAVLRRGDRDAPRRGVLHPPARSRSRTRASRRSSSPSAIRASSGCRSRHARRDEPALGALPVAHREPRHPVAIDRERIFVRDLEVPSGGGVGTARGLAARTASSPATGTSSGCARDARGAAAPAIPPRHGFRDECFAGGAVQFSLGFMKPTPVWPFGHAGAFGAPGAGGAIGYADPRPASATATSRTGWAARR